VGPLVSFLLPLALWALAWGLARRELRQYRAAAEIGSDLFAYGKGRLVRRMIGVGVLALLGGTLAALDIAPARTAARASVYLTLLLAEVILLVGLAVLDLWETARTARPEDLTRQGGQPRRTRTGPRPPPSAAS
jgi:hypothetical protein